MSNTNSSLLQLSKRALRVSAVGVSALLSACAGTSALGVGPGKMLAEGADVPALQTTDHRGQALALNDGASVRVIYFFPKDNTPGCTAEACAFRDTWDRFVEAGVEVVGVSTDNLESHRAFAEKYELPFGLVADPDLEWAHAFGVKTMLGFTARVSFLVDKSGKIARVYPGVDPAIHATQVLADAAALPTP